jgi:hypothetical protein
MRTVDSRNVEITPATGDYGVFNCRVCNNEAQKTFQRKKSAGRKLEMFKLLNRSANAH